MVKPEVYVRVRNSIASVVLTDVPEPPDLGKDLGHPTDHHARAAERAVERDDEDHGELTR